MSSKHREEEEVFISDSFLDIVANVVGILIILVIVVGLRVRHVPESTSEVSAEVTDQMTRSQANVTALESEIVDLHVETADVTRALASAFAQRKQLAYEVERLRVAQDGALGRAGEEQRELASLERQVQEKLVQSDSLAAELADARETPKDVVRVVSYPTAISQTVTGEEIHFQLKGERIAYIPLDGLLARMKSDVRRGVRHLSASQEIAGAVGPVRGFRMRYAWERYHLPARSQSELGGGGTVIRLTEFTLYPESDDMGETIDEALRSDSAFRLTLSQVDPAASAVTLWVYPESFAEFRRLKEELFRLGFATAGRPLPAGTPIGGSPNGSRSAAQ